jgi:hypothetical protein
MAVYVNNITINTGEYFSRDFYLDNIDGTSLNLVGYAASSYIRKHPESLSPTAKFNVGFVDRDNGKIRVSLASTITATIKPGRYVYDVLFTDTEDKKSIVIEGNVLATDDISTGCQFLKLDYDKKWGAITNAPGSGGDQGRRNNVLEDATIDTLDNYGVVIFGYHSVCGGIPNTVATVQANIDIIQQYITNGGIVWFRGEWGSCGNQTQSNQILDLLGTVMRLTNPGSEEASGATNLTKVTSSTLMPPMTSSASNYVELNGAYGLYKFGSGYTAAYEKIGGGVIFVQSDVDGSWESPSDALYEGLRDLVVSEYYSYT